MQLLADDIYVYKGNIPDSTMKVLELINKFNVCVGYTVNKQNQFISI